MSIICREAPQQWTVWAHGGTTLINTGVVNISPFCDHCQHVFSEPQHYYNKVLDTTYTNNVQIYIVFDQLCCSGGKSLQVVLVIKHCDPATH